ncbi:hypothetical protein BJ508DRAFT_366290 [Ascobolus immersus RN42]|uniref:C2H2-domain containing protein second zinc finger domain-containing protein n=1 Tax=Ascobolus immersus RN42 TaxID=1160509 RepID=A0A3N4HKI4_ASCIM|nr:hypothetical protein BJ508DRAFT_366290 [Ascobolus immersus RN42]
MQATWITVEDDEAFHPNPSFCRTVLGTDQRFSVELGFQTYAPTTLAIDDNFSFSGLPQAPYQNSSQVPYVAGESHWSSSTSLALASFQIPTNMQDLPIFGWQHNHFEVRTNQSSFAALDHEVISASEPLEFANWSELGATAFDAQCASQLADSDDAPMPMQYEFGELKERFHSPEIPPSNTAGSSELSFFNEPYDSTIGSYSSPDSHSLTKLKSRSHHQDIPCSMREHLCPRPDCGRSVPGNGFKNGRIDNLRNHLRQVHGENIPKLKAGRKKEVPSFV